MSAIRTCCASSVLEVGEGMPVRAESMKTVGSCTAAGCPRAAFMKRQEEEQRVPWCPAVRPVARLEGTQGSREGGSSSHLPSRSCWSLVSRSRPSCEDAYVSTGAGCTSFCGGSAAAACRREQSCGAPPGLQVGGGLPSAQLAVQR